MDLPSKNREKGRGVLAVKKVKDVEIECGWEEETPRIGRGEEFAPSMSGVGFETTSHAKDAKRETMMQGQSSKKR